MVFLGGQGKGRFGPPRVDDFRIRGEVCLIDFPEDLTFLSEFGLAGPLGQHEVRAGRASDELPDVH